MDLPVYEILTAVLVVLSSVSYIPQLIQIIKTKSAKDLSLMSWFLYDIYFALYIALLFYERTHLGVILVSSVDAVLCLAITIAILICNHKEQRKEKLCHIATKL